MENNICISVENLSKSFRVYHDRGHTLKEKLIRTARTSFENRQILKDVSLQIQQGHSVGLIGRNGSGKSTLLKLMTGIIYADCGKIDIKGKVSSLLELGAGFHPDFSGRENIYINASIFGLSRREIDRRYDEIVRFSELEPFIDNPVRTYSSGMYMRLAFSVAINVDADILFVDEVLAVGDTNFQKKCMDKISDLRMEGKTIVLVTHDLGAVEKICDEAIWLEQGRIFAQGLPKRIIDEYMMFMETEQSNKPVEGHSAAHVSSAASELQETRESVDQKNKPDSHVNTTSPARISSCSEQSNERWGNTKAVIESVRLTDADGTEKNLFHPDEPIHVWIHYSFRESINDIVAGFGIFTRDRKQCYGTNTLIDGVHLDDMPLEGSIRIVLPDNQLINNSYVLDVALHTSSGVPYDYIINAAHFGIYTNRNDVGITRIHHEWIVPEEQKHG